MRQASSAGAIKLKRRLAKNPDLLTKITKFAARRLNRHHGRLQVRGLSPEDIVQDIFKSILEGERSCPGTLSEEHLQGMVNSRVSNVSRKRCPPVVLAGDIGLSSQSPYHDRVVSETPPPDVVVQQRELNDRDRYVLELFQRQVADDRELVDFINALLTGAERRDEIARHLGLSAARVTNIQKRFDRRCLLFRSEYPDREVAERR